MSNPLFCNKRSCTFKPPISCKHNDAYNRQYHNTPMVVMKDPQYSWTEIEIGRIIDIFDPNHEYFIPLTGDWCTINNSPNIQQYINFIGNPEGHFAKYDGELVSQILKHQTISVDNLIMWTKHITVGLKFLHEVGICHMNLNSNTIMISDGLPKLIDFGLSLFSDNCAVDNMPPFNTEYPIWMSQVYSKSQIEYMYNSYWKNIEKYFPQVKKGDAEEDPIVKYYDIHNQLNWSDEEYIKEIIVPYLEKVDTYMLGMTIINILETLPHTDQWDQLHQLCINCIDPLVDYQYDTTQILEYIEQQGW